MKQQLSSLEALAAKLTAQRAVSADYVAPSTDIKMNTAGKIDSSSAGIVDRILRKTAHRQLAEITDIPGAYYERMRATDPALLSQNVNRWMGARTNSRQMLRTIDGEVRAILSDRYARIDNYQVAEVVLDILSKQEGLEIVSSAVTDDHMHIKAIVTNDPLIVPGSKRVGDLVDRGVAIRNSETGMGALSISPFAHYRVCTNGMVRNDARLRASHVGRKIDASLEGLLSEGTRRLEDATVISKVKDILAHCFDKAAFETYIAKMAELTQQQIEGDVAAAVGSLRPALGLSIGECSGVLRHLAAGGDLSRYGLVNAVTRTAEDVEDYDRATEIEGLGFKLATLPARDWKQIANAEAVAA